MLLSEVEDLRSVRVLDPRRDAGLVEKHLLEAFVRGELRKDRFDGYELFEPVLAVEPREPDGGHSAVRDGAQTLIAI